MAIDTAPAPRLQVPPVEARRLRPVVGWAIVGAAVVLLAAYCFISWIGSGQAHPVGTGTDRVPTYVRVAVTAFEVLSCASAVVAVTYVVRKSLSERKLCLDAMILLGWTVAWWHDPLINWLRPTVFYNAYALNFGSWTERVPGWFSPNAHTMPEPVLIIGTVYVWMGLLCAVAVGAIMSAVRERRPRWGPVALFLSAWAGIFVFEFCMELVAVRLQLVAYPSSIHSLTLWAGHTYQMPIYEQLLWSLVLTAPGVLRFYRGGDGRTAVERGADRLPFGGRRNSAVRLLAIVAFVNVVALGYDVAMIGSSLYPGRTSTYPTYLRTHQCGPGTTTACPGPRVPLVSSRY